MSEGDNTSAKMDTDLPSPDMNRLSKSLSEGAQLKDEKHEIVLEAPKNEQKTENVKPTEAEKSKEDKKPEESVTMKTEEVVPEDVKVKGKKKIVSPTLKRSPAAEKTEQVSHMDTLDMIMCHFD